jgi:hypothetical protein
MAQPTSAEELRNKPPSSDIDPNVILPKAVAEAGKRSDIIQASLATGGPPSNGELQETGNDEVQLQPPGEIAPNGQGQEPPEENLSPEDWKRRYNAMRGRVDQQSEQMHQMAEQLQRLQVRSNSSAPAPQRQDAPRKLLSDQEIEDYGPEFVDVVRRAAAEVATPLYDEVQHLRDQLGQVQTETANAFMTRMNATIGGLVPNWQEVNRHPAFVQWVGLPEVYSGVIRQQLMQEAWNNGDAQRVAAFFRAFLAEEAAVDPRRAGSGAQSYRPAAYMPPVAPVHRPTLEQFAAPGRAQSGAPAPTDKPVYTAQDITRFYTECSAGKWRTREAERAAIDADIIQAQHEGRIISDQRTIRPMDWNGNR